MWNSAMRQDLVLQKEGAKLNVTQCGLQRRDQDEAGNSRNKHPGSGRQQGMFPTAKHQAP